MSTEEEALLASIEASPLDNAPRLIYADWLQEHGDDAKAEYLRAVVTLLNPPENKAILDRLLEIAPLIDVKWRQRVGARFEVMLEGEAIYLTLANLFGVLLNRAFFANVQLRETGKPVLLKSALTREEAADFVMSFGVDVERLTQESEHRLRMSIAPMKEVASIGLFP